MDKVRYGIIGIGKMGHIHALKINKFKSDKNAVLTAVCDIDENKRKWAKETLKNVEIFDDYIKMFDSKLIDAVIIATPHYLHPVIAKESLNRKIHTLIEKPAGVFTKAIRELNEVAAKNSDVVFGIMYNQRSNPLYRKAKEIIEKGEMGNIKRINWIITNWYRPQAYYDQGGWRGTWEGEGGGVLINQCPHQIDLFQWLSGLPKKVRGYAKVGVNRDINVENDVTAYFEYENGATGVFITSTHDFPGTNRLEIDGDGGKIVIEKNKLIFNKLETFESEFNKVNKAFMPRIKNSKIVKKNSLVTQLKILTAQHMNIIRNFSNAILNGEKLIAPGIEGIDGLTLSNAIHLSSWLDKEITLPIDEDLFIKQLNKRIEEEKITSKKK